MKVLIIGASGFIGLPMARAFVRAGHIVYGVTRSETKAEQLAAEEVIPVVADSATPAVWYPLVATLDVVIDTTASLAPGTHAKTLLSATVDAAKQHRPPHAPKLTYIYTSGTWVHGDDRKEIITDTTPITKPVERNAWKPAVEQDVITNSVVNGIVIRPSLVYGRSGSNFAPLFRKAYDGEVVWYGRPGARYAMVHTDDLAVLYVLAAEKGSIVGGKIFDAANDFTESVDDILQKLVEVSGAKHPYKYILPSNVTETALTTTCLLRPYLARSLLGWQPRKAGFVDYLDIYYDAWKAAQGL